MGSEHYCLRWNNHQANLLGVCAQLLRDERLVDVTLACADEGRCIRAHKVVLSACSAYFRALFVDHPARHPIVILKDVRFSDLRTIVEFMYKGEVRVEYAQLNRLLQTAESLKVKGLAEMTQEYKPDPPEQTEPEELVSRRPPSLGTGDPTPPRNSPVAAVPPPRQSPEPLPRPPSQNGSPEPPLPPTNSFGPPPTLVGCRPSPPLNCDPLPGPSNLPPIQQVPLSLKKEVDWGGGLEDKNSGGESSSEYSRMPHDSERPDDGADAPGASSSPPRIYPCMYCGISFPHQSKLTRHILSHSLETLKYREQRGMPSLSIPEPAATSWVDARSEPPDPTDQPPTPMDLDDAASPGGVVLCKFCGKSFPDVAALIAHLPAHTGDRPFKCEFCGKAFKLRHHMKDHCRVHTGERPFRCSLCGKTFSRSTILKAHEKTHYPKYVRKFLSPSPLDTEEENPH
ncbi:hypothetical protein HUJ05_002249 [Dendroctonus ponderosae]|nr:hypothetical protein HUJ05_002249 [Dendroctonus ponderosae]